MARCLLVWDAPNMDMSLTNVLGKKPTADMRPNYAAVARWLCQQSPANAEIEACVFVNIPDEAEAAERMLPWVMAVRRAGFAVFAKPKLAPHDDIDEALLEHVKSRLGPSLALLVLASHDGRGFASVMQEAAAHGTRTVVLGFAEQMSSLLRTSAQEVVDLEDIQGAFRNPLPRTRLMGLPPEGRWFPPFVSLSAAASTPDDEALDDPASPTEEPPALDAVVEAVTAIVSEAGEPVLLGTLGHLVRDRLPSFSPVAFGYPKLLPFVEEIAPSANVEVVKRDDGHPVVRLAG